MTLEDLCGWNREELLALWGFGVKCIGEVDAFLDANDLLPAVSVYSATANVPNVNIYEELSPRTRDLLQHAGVKTPQDLRTKSISELLEVAGLDEESLNEILTWCPPAVRDEQDLLWILAIPRLPALARVLTRLETFAPPALNEVLDSLMQCQDKVAQQIELGTLHERALMDWGAVQAVNGKLRPPAQTLPDFLFRLQYCPGRVVGTAGRLSEALDAGTVDEEMPLLLGRLNDCDQEIVRERFSLGGRPTLDELGERFDLTRERIRQREKQATKEMAQAYYWGPSLPRTRTAMFLVRQSDALTPESIYDLLSQRGLIADESTIGVLLAVWRAIATGELLLDESPINDLLVDWKVIDPVGTVFPEDIISYAKMGLTSYQKGLFKEVDKVAGRLVRQIGAVTPAQIVADLPDRGILSEDDVIAILRQSEFRQITPGYWGGGGANRYSVPRQVVGKMLSICGPLSLRHLRRGLLRHERRQGYPVAPVSILRDVLSQYGEFSVGEDDIVSLAHTSIRPKLGKWERVWLDLVKAKGPLIHADSIHQAFIENQLKPVTAYVLMRNSAIVEAIGKGLFCLPGAQFSDADIAEARGQALNIDANPVLTYDETGTAIFETTAQQYMVRNGSLGAGPAAVLKGRWKTVVNEEEIGEFTVGQPWIYGLSEARDVLNIEARDRVQIRFDTWTRKAHISILSRAYGN